jgi:hypothetical protein
VALPFKGQYLCGVKFPQFSGHNSELFFAVNEDATASKVVQILAPYDFNDSGLVNSGIAPFWNFSPDWNS